MFVVVAIFILNFGQVHQVDVRALSFCSCSQILVIFIRSYSFGHLDLVMLTTLNKPS